ncbi:hypothetical protein RFI_04001 [Reticulomyxa filosa]|uniref:Kelch motif family protein n=1 Tax=Reticulomyxa filosa TaxID=46433 RepID=X6P4G5_RETFI|nr:hypothetical protein RFI_04001 [Reticulomyxa filosa]|eukprot:ETO33106.1 hypothetical protein RFI_04001 [Reticulomyxa filosa]
MGNRTTTQKETKQSQHLITSTSFQTLKELPTRLSQSQCVLHKHELLICGGLGQRACYSYHTLKNEYKFICEYPSDVTLIGYCVVKLVDNNNNNNKDRSQISLLSFGGFFKHTLMMKYVSVWSNISDISNKSNELNNYNQWTPFTDNHNHRIIIGKNENHHYIGVRAVIGGRNNNLLFITYQYNNISVFDLNSFQFIKHDTLPIAADSYIHYHCFVSKSENGQEQGQEMMKTNKQKYEMLLFYFKTGLSIEYDEDDNIFQFHQLSVCDDIVLFNCYAHVCINDIILFFGGLNHNNHIFSKSVYKYSIEENKWTIFQNTLPNSLYNCVAILSEDNTHIHIIGGRQDDDIELSTHMKTKVHMWDDLQLVINELIICLFYLFNQIQINNK